MNSDLDAAWAYHNGTKHSHRSIRSNPHYLDWQNQPLPFKIYNKLESIALPLDVSQSAVTALEAITSASARSIVDCVPDLRTLGRILYFCSGITKRKMYPGREILFRAASCTGAQYHIDLYIICGETGALGAGIYQLGVHDFALRRLRQGDFRSLVARATGYEASVAAAPVIIAFASTYWRNAWKYQARTYRHCFWDTGTILANLLAVANAHAVPARVIGGFVDATLSQLFALDEQREGIISLVVLGQTQTPQPSTVPEKETLDLEIQSLSKQEVDYPAIREMHGASSLRSEAEVAGWRSEIPPAALPSPSGSLFPLRPLAENEEPTDSIEQVIGRRGSTREFALEPITFAQLSTILRSSTSAIPADFLDPNGATLNDLYLIVNAVDDLPSGAYVYHRGQEALELLREGKFRGEAGVLGLEQALPASASVNVFFLADLDRALGRFGNRGYRAAQLEAGIIGGRLYLSAYALRLGASGLTFYDDDVTAFFSPHAGRKSAMFLVALGKSARRVKSPQVRA